jgi:hypothetical protein
MDSALIKKLAEEDGVVFLVYSGFLSQTLISSMTEVLEKESKLNGLGLSESTSVYTIFIELAQNMMNYSKDKQADSDELTSGGLIWVGYDGQLPGYYVQSRNVIDIKDKEKIEPKLAEILTMDNDAIKQRYRELRKSGRDSHAKGGGIGFYEIAKRASQVSYSFEAINDTRFYFNFKANVMSKKASE